MAGETPKTEPTLMDTALKELGVPMLYEAMGGNEKVWAYREKFPKEFDAALKEHDADAATIKAQEDIATLQIDLRIVLLFKAYFADFFGGASEAVEQMRELILPDALKAKMKEFTFADFKAYNESKMTQGIQFLEGSAHAITDKKLFDGFDTLASMTLDKPGEVEKWPEFFPYAPGTRVVLGGKAKDEVTKLSGWATPFFEKAGVKLTIVAEGEPSGEAASDEIQVVAMKEESPLNKENVLLCQKLWKDQDTPAQFSCCPNTLAAVQVLEGKTPEDACKTVGIEAPTADFLKELEGFVPEKSDAEADIDDEEEEGKEEAMKSAQVFLKEKYGEKLETSLDFSKARVIAPDDTGKGGFVKSFEFMTNESHKDEFPGNVALQQSDIAYFINVPSADGSNSELVAVNDSYEVIGLAS